MEPISVLVDDRERAIIAELARDRAEPCWWECKRLPRADYVFCNPQMAFMMVERKTYEDFAQSIKDGRMENLAALIEICGARGECRGTIVALLLEGARPTDDNALICGIPFANIRAKLDHLWMRDGVHIVETLNARDTALRLHSLLINMNSWVNNRHSAPIAAPSTGAALMRATEKSQEEIVYLMFRQFPSIGPKSAQECAKSGHSIADVFLAPDQNPLFARAAAKYAANATPLAIDVEILSRVPHVSRQFARDVLLCTPDGTVRPLAILCRMTQPEITAICVRKGKTMHTIAKNLFTYLHYRAHS
jgi:ERCC4-type nuclease